MFAGSDGVVKFEPVGPEDVQAAEQETDYINHGFMNQNPGFLVLYSFIKDALLSKTGIVKVWWEEESREEQETYYDKSPDEYALIVSSPDVDVIEHSEHDGLHDVTVSIKRSAARAHALGVPPEEFGIERGARNIRDCNYCFHKVVDRTESDLIAQGYDPKQVKTLPTFPITESVEEFTRDTVDENRQANSSEMNPASRIVEVTEHYIRMDYEGDGKPCLYRVTTGGSQGDILVRDGEPDIIKFDAIPFAAMTPVIVTHRFYGKSLADLAMDIQRIKTALLRGLLDNQYLSLNRRVEVSEAHAGDNTLDDLLVSRPGGIVRVKQPGGLREIEHMDISASVYPALEYMDQRLETRTGFNKRGQGIEPDALSNQSATAAKIVENASQARVRLIARIFAETGVRDLFWLLHATIKKHAQQASVVRLRNNWVSVDPRSWKNRDDLTVHVGLGSGGRSQQLVEAQIIIEAQSRAIQAGMISKRNLFASAKKLVRIVGEKDVETYFTDPSKPPDQNDPSAQPITPPPDPKMQQIQLQAQLDAQADQRKAQIEGVQAQADIQTQRDKTQAEMVQTERDFQLKQNLAVMHFQLERELKLAEEGRKAREHEQKMAHQQQMHEYAMKQGAFNLVAGAQAHAQKMEQRPDG